LLAVGNGPQKFPPILFVAPPSRTPRALASLPALRCSSSISNTISSISIPRISIERSRPSSPITAWRPRSLPRTIHSCVQRTALSCPNIALYLLSHDSLAPRTAASRALTLTTAKADRVHRELEVRDREGLAGAHHALRTCRPPSRSRSVGRLPWGGCWGRDR